MSRHKGAIRETPPRHRINSQRFDDEPPAVAQPLAELKRAERRAGLLMRIRQLERSNAVLEARMEAFSKRDQIPGFWEKYGRADAEDTAEAFQRLAGQATGAPLSPEAQSRVGMAQAFAGLGLSLAPARFSRPRSADEREDGRHAVAIRGLLGLN